MEFWDKLFQIIGTSWGHKPAQSAVKASRLFSHQKIKNVLIPGIGYGRNVRPFTNKGMKVKGIEISKTAVNLAKAKNIKLLRKIHNGSVLDMPFDESHYSGIYCYSLLHLFNKHERKKLIANCYAQLSQNGLMIFVVLSKKSNMYGQGKYISSDRYQLQKGLNVYFYDLNSVKAEFKDYGLINAYEYIEPIDQGLKTLPLNCIYIQCQKRPPNAKCFPGG